MRLPARALLVALAVGATVASGTSVADGNRAATPRLKAFTSCAGLIGYARRHIPPPP